MHIFTFIVFSSKTILLIIIGLKNDVISQKSKFVAGFDEQDIFKKFVARKKNPIWLQNFLELKVQQCYV